MPEKKKIATMLSEKVVPQAPFGTDAERARRSLNAKLSNPLAGFSHTELRNQGRTLAELHEMGDESDIRAFELGAMLAQCPEQYANVTGLTNQEKGVLHRELTYRWSQPWKMYAVITLCSLSATVQGMGKYIQPEKFQAPEEYPGDNIRPDGRQRSPDILQTPIRHRRRILSECLARRSSKFSTIPLLRLHQLLANSPIQPLVRAPRYNIHSMLLVCDYLSLAGVRLNMVGDVRRTIHARLRHRPQVSNCADIRGRNSTTVHPWCVGHAVACVDGVWDYGWLCVGPHLLQCRLDRHRRLELALYDGLGDVPASGRLLFCLCLS